MRPEIRVTFPSLFWLEMLTVALQVSVGAAVARFAQFNSPLLFLVLYLFVTLLGVILSVNWFALLLLFLLLRIDYIKQMISAVGVRSRKLLVVLIVVAIIAVRVPERRSLSVFFLVFCLSRQVFSSVMLSAAVFGPVRTRC